MAASAIATLTSASTRASSSASDVAVSASWTAIWLYWRGPAADIEAVQQRPAGRQPLQVGSQPLVEPARLARQQGNQGVVRSLGDGGVRRTVGEGRQRRAVGRVALADRIERFEDGDLHDGH